MTVGELRAKLEVVADSFEIYFHDLNHGRLPVEEFEVQTWEKKFVHHKWDGPETALTGGWRKVVTTREQKGVVLG